MLLDEKKLNNFLNLKFNENIIDIQKIGEGYISEVFKIITNRSKKIFKFIKNSNIKGFEYVYDIQRSLNISHIMYNNAYLVNKIKSYGIFDLNGKIVHILDFVNAKNIQFQDLVNDFELLNKISYKIALLHSMEVNLPDNEKLDLYRRGFREIFSNYETLLSVYEGYYVGSEHEQLGWEIFQKILLFYRNYLNNITDNLAIKRVSFLHGDFWYDNVLLTNKKEVFFIDFSRIPYGDPGIDIGRFIGEFLVNYVISQDKKYINFVRNFIDKYIYYSKDEQIINFLDISILWVFFIDCSPLVQQYLNWDNEKFKLIKDFIKNYSGFDKLKL